MTNENTFIAALAYCLFMLIMGLIFKKFPPKKINMFYGYRTKRSMANQEVWDAANSYWIKIFTQLNLLCCIVPLVSYVALPSYTILVITIGSSVLLLLVSIPLTEIYLNKYFDKNGNPK